MVHNNLNEAMTLEQRARAIADKTRYLPGHYMHRKIEAFALQMLREATERLAKEHQ